MVTSDIDLVVCAGQACSSAWRGRPRARPASSSPTLAGAARPARARPPSGRGLHRRGDPPRHVAFSISARRASRRAARPRRRRRRRRAARRGRDSGRSRPSGAPASRAARSRAVADWRSTRTLERLQSAQQEPGRIGRGDDPGARRGTSRSASAVAASGRRRRRAARRGARRGTSSRCAATKSAPCSSGRRSTASRPSRRRGRARGARRRASRSGIVRNGFDGASSQTSCTPSGGGRSGRTRRSWRPQRSSACEDHARAEVAALGERDRVARARAARARAPTSLPVPEGKRSAVAAVELAERALGLDAGRVRRSAGSRTRPARRRRTARGRAVDVAHSGDCTNERRWVRERPLGSGDRPFALCRTCL